MALERARPDPARQAFALVLAHQLEQVGLVMTLLVVQLARVQLHRRTPGVGLHAATPPAGAARAIDLHDHVADLSRAAAPGPRLAVEDQSAANSRPPEDAEQRVIRPSSAELELRVGGDLHVVADADRDPADPSASRRVAASGNVPSQPGRLRALVTFPSSIVPGEPTPIPASSAGSISAALAASRSAPSISAATSSVRRSSASDGVPIRAPCGRRRRQPSGSSSRRGRSRRRWSSAPSSRMERT